MNKGKEAINSMSVYVMSVACNVASQSEVYPEMHKYSRQQ